MQSICLRCPAVSNQDAFTFRMYALCLLQKDRAFLQRVRDACNVLLAGGQLRRLAVLGSGPLLPTYVSMLPHCSQLQVCCVSKQYCIFVSDKTSDNTHG